MMLDQEERRLQKISKLLESTNMGKDNHVGVVVNWDGILGEILYYGLWAGDVIQLKGIVTSDECLEEIHTGDVVEFQTEAEDLIAQKVQPWKRSGSDNVILAFEKQLEELQEVINQPVQPNEQHLGIVDNWDGIFGEIIFVGELFGEKDTVLK